MKVLEMIFSPTEGTKKAAQAIVKGLGKEAQFVDLTDVSADFEAVEISEEDICVIAVPSYSGRVPKTAAERLLQIKGNQAKAVLVVVYGNREFDDTLVELQDLAVEAAFMPVAAISAIAEHSIVRKFAAGRPDAEDCKELEQFGIKILDAIENQKTTSLSLPGNRPYKEVSGSLAKPMANDACTKCGVCAAKCPVGAIPKDSPEQTNTENCISCMRCISICPNQARQLSPELLTSLEQRLAPVCTERKVNELYL